MRLCVWSSCVGFSGVALFRLAVSVSSHALVVVRGGGCLRAQFSLVLHARVFGG